MLILLLSGAASFSQTASLATVTASPGQNIPVALNVTGFTGIGSITFNIQFDTTVMTFTGITLPSGSPGGFYTGVTGTSLNITGAWYPYQTFPDGKLFDLNFTYYGMTTSPLNFLGSCQVTQGVTPIYPAYTNGSVSMANVPQKANLVGGTAATGSNISALVEYAAMPTNIGAITQKVHYDPTKLTFISVTGSGNLLTGINFSADITNGLITFTWTNTGGTDINYLPTGTNYFMLNFIYTGSTTTNVDFVAGCIISTAPPVTNVAVTYAGSTISLNNSPTATAVLGSVTGALQGQDYEVPLTLAGFPTGISGGTQAFTLTIPFDSPRLSFIGVSSPAPSGLVVNQASGVITLAWSDPSGPNINSNPPFLKLKFKYNGIGTANVSFGNGCVFNTNTGGVIGTVQVAYTNATITPATATANATIGFVQATAGNNVLVPVNFSGLPVPPTGMGAVTLFITYDYNKLTFIDAQNNTYGANVNLDASTHIISIAWASGSATDINHKFLDLRFTYNAGGGGCGAAVSFTDDCELANSSAVIVPANWNNGGVNLMFKISGYLTYDGAPRPDTITLRHVTVYCKTNPGGVVVTSTTTDATGYYEFYVPNGSYYLDAATTKPWGGVTILDVAYLRAKVQTATPLPFEDALRLKAGDVDQNGVLTILDVALLQSRAQGGSPPLYTAPDWLFEHPVLTINCANASMNFHGICSGDVNGSYPNPIP